MKTKAPLCRILKRATRSLVVMKQLAKVAGPGRAPMLVSPEEFEALLDALLGQAGRVARHEEKLARCAGAWDGVLRGWHREAVKAVRVGRVSFRGTVKAPAWRGLKARGGGRARIAREGAALETAWASSDPAWTPKRGVTLAGFQQRRLDAEKKSRAHARAASQLAIARGGLLAQADVLYELCVNWYVVATAVFKAATPEGKVIRTVPTNYDLNPPGEPAAGGREAGPGFVPVLVGDGGSGAQVIPMPFVPWPERVGEGPGPVRAPAACDREKDGVPPAAVA